jgi:hypothetical protein
LETFPVSADRATLADIAPTGCGSPAQPPCSNFGTNHKRVLLIRAGQLGDTIWASAAVEAIRQTFGSSVEIDFLIKQGHSKGAPCETPETLNSIRLV